MHRKVLETHDRDLAERLSGLEVELYLVPRYAERITLHATPWTLEQLGKLFDVCKAALRGCRTTGHVSLCFLLPTAQGLGYQNEQEGAQTGSGYSFPVCHSQHSHCGRPKGEKHCFSRCTQACKVWSVHNA